MQCGKVTLPLPWLLSSTPPPLLSPLLLRFTCSNYSDKSDWNAELLDSESSDSHFVRCLMDELSLKLVEMGPSHHTAYKDTWIYILLTDKNDTVVSHDRKLLTFPSRHDIISVTIETLRPETPTDSYNYRCIGKIIRTGLSLFLQNKD